MATATSILLYAPNIVGYVRLVLLALAFGVLAETEPLAFVLVYTLNVLLDGSEPGYERFNVIVMQESMAISRGHWTRSRTLALGFVVVSLHLIIIMTESRSLMWLSTTSGDRSSGASSRR